MSKELLKACKKDNINQAKELLKKSFDICYRDRFYQSCLYWTCKNNNTELAKLLLKNGAKDTINDIILFNETCLYWACYNDNIELVKLLLENGAIIEEEVAYEYLNLLLNIRL